MLLPWQRRLEVWGCLIASWDACILSDRRSWSMMSRICTAKYRAKQKPADDILCFKSSSLTETTKNMVMCRKSPALKKQRDHDDIFYIWQTSNTSSVFQADFTISCLDSLQRLLPALRTNGNSWDFESKKYDRNCGVMTEKAFCLGTAPGYQESDSNISERTELGTTWMQWPRASRPSTRVLCIVVSPISICDGSKAEKTRKKTTELNLCGWSADSRNPA